MQTLNEHLTKRPHKLSAFHYYMKLYYSSKMKAEYEQLFPLLIAEYEGASEEEQANLKKPMPVNVRAEIGMRFWLAESQAFRDEIEKRRDDEHAKEMEKWETTQRIPRTPQEYHHQLTYTGQYIRPVAEAIASRMEAAVAIFIIGPVAEKNGDVEVRRFVILADWRTLFINGTSIVFIQTGRVVCRVPFGRHMIPLGMQRSKRLLANMEEQYLVSFFNQ